jgi:hypothetical protein
MDLGRKGADMRTSTWRAGDSTDWGRVEQGCILVAERLDDALTAIHAIGTQHPTLRWSVEVQHFIDELKDLREGAHSLAARANALSAKLDNAVHGDECP